MKSFIIKRRLWFVVVFKLAIISTALLLAFLLRFDLRMTAAEWRTFLALLPALVCIKFAFFWKTGLTSGWWRYVSLSDVIDLFKANVAASLIFLLYAVFVHGMTGIPRSVLILDCILCFLLSCGVRFATRAFRENYIPMSLSLKPNDLKRILIIGAGQAGQMIARETRQNLSLKMSVTGFIDDDPNKARKRFQGIAVLGDRADIVRIAGQEKIDEIIIAIPSASGNELRPIVERCQETKLPFKTLPGVGDLMDGTVSIQQVRDVDLNDLLGRKPIRLEMEKIQSFLEGKRVLVTGAAGSIGSEICRQAARFKPARMVLFETAETPLFFIEKELRERFPELRLTAIMGDIRDRARVNSVFSELGPDVVFHAAAYKHVPMMESNPTSAAHNNVWGTKVVADAANEFGIESFVMISTDKAVNPTNVMGATKRAAELYVQNLARFSNTKFVTVRFGNVLGSNGSVVPIFKEQIRNGGPVTITHPEITRYFMTIPEATQLVLQAGSMGWGGEIFLLDMGEPVKIVHLAEELIRISGLRPYEDIDITFTGLRPGEKLYEELLLAGEGIQPTGHEKIKVARATYCEWIALNLKLERLYRAARMLDVDTVVDMLENIVPEYRSHLKWGRSCYEEGELGAAANEKLLDESPSAFAQSP